MKTMETLIVFLVSMSIFALPKNSIIVDMKNKILQAACDLFLNFGVKSVTMDDLATHLSISKKTIYEYFNTKEGLVRSTTDYVFDHIETELTEFLEVNQTKNPIELLFETYEFFKQKINQEQAPEFQLKKYFPDIYDDLTQKKSQLTIRVTKKNLKQGIEQGYYRSDIDLDVISKFYFAMLIEIRDNDMFPSDLYKQSQIMYQFTIYHIRAIATAKGIQILENYLSKHEI